MYIYIFITIIVIIIINETCLGIYRQLQRNNIFKLAKKRASELNKPLTVVGDPYYGYGSRFYNMFLNGYECGDKTIDLTGAPLCPNGIKSDIYDYLKNEKSNSQVIFISCVLEYIDNIEDVINELYRVAGNENIFIVTVNKFSLAAFFYSEDNYSAKNLIYAPPLYKNITWEKI